MFINSVHPSFDCVDPRWRGVCACVYVCESPEVSCPGGCSVAPPRGPEKQRQPLLKSMTNGQVISWWPWWITQMSVEVLSALAETALRPNVFFVGRVGLVRHWSLRQIEFFSPKKHRIEKKPVKAEKQEWTECTPAAVHDYLWSEFSCFCSIVDLSLPITEQTHSPCDRK